jgi:agmatinase
MEPVRNFTGLGRDHCDWKTSRIAILPVPYDKTSTWIKGADKGPFAIIEASPALEFYDIETDSEVFKRGIFTAPAVNSDLPPEKMATETEKRTAELIDAGKFVVVLGGEHSVSVGPVRAFSSRVKDLSVLHLDAHSDLRDEYEGSKYSHACVASRFKESSPVVHVGVRSMDAEEKTKFLPQDMFFAHDILGQKGKDWVKKVLTRLTPNVYVTIDLDVFDPSIMPSTGTPEPGGLGWYDVIGLLREVAKKKNVVGFDCVELCPQENNKAPDFMAAKVVYTFLSYIFAKRERCDG